MPDYIARSDKNRQQKDMTALFRIGYEDCTWSPPTTARRDNGLIVNTVSRVTDLPNRGRDHQQAPTNPPRHPPDGHHERQLPVGGCAVCCVFQTFGPERPHGGQVRRLRGRSGPSLGQRAGVPAALINAFMSLKVEKLYRPRPHWHVHLLGGEARHQRARNHRPTPTTRTTPPQAAKPRAEAGLGLARCAGTSRGDTLPDDFICPLQARGGGFRADFVTDGGRPSRACAYPQALNRRAGGAVCPAGDKAGAKGPRRNAGAPASKI